MKTFHSTAVLRYLFTVHTSLAEFDTGFKALDTYLDMVTKGRSRVQKSGIPESSLDDDETAIRTAAEGISILCRFGSREQVEKARDLGRKLEQWLEEYNLGSPLQKKPNGQDSATAVYEENSERSIVSPEGLAIAYRAIGISQAHWAEMTYEATTRAEIQASALQNLQKSLTPGLGNSENLETLFALGMLSAKTRDLGAAIQVVKRALSSTSRSSSRHDILTEKQALIGPVPAQNIIIRQRRLIPFWHLLTLLMSAEQEWTNAVQSCAAAFEQFGDPSCLFGAEDLLISEREYEDAATSSNQRDDLHRAGSGVVDNMDLYEKYGIVEVKMTQLALTEVLEGPEAALNACDELFALFTRLFRDLEVLVPQKFKKEAAAPPQSSSGTVKSLRGSLFGRPKTSHKKTHKANTSVSSTVDPGTIGSNVARHSHDAAAAPMIQVTGDVEEVSKLEPHHHHRHHHLFHHDAGSHGQKLQKRSESLNNKKSFGSFRRKGGSSSTNSALIPSRAHSDVPEVAEEDKVSASGQRPIGDYTVRDENQRATNPATTSTPPRAVGAAMAQNLPPPAPPPGEAHNESPNATQHLSSIAHNSHPRQQPLPLAHKHPTPHQDVRLPTTSPHTSSTQPAPRLPKARERRHALSLLVKIWLLIASLYRRAGMPDDARGACDEAFTHVQTIEAEVAAQTSSSSRAFEERHWGCCRSVDELWGDVYTERGNLEQTLAAPQQATEYYERALFHCVDHPAATVALANLLLDVYTQTAPSPEHPARSATSNSFSAPYPHDSSFPTSCSLDPDDNDNETNMNSLPPLQHDPSQPTMTNPPTTLHNETNLLARLAARDRAHGLLSSLTKLGSGWDNSEAWFALARAYEEGGQVDRAKEVLWWCVELEDTRPVRGWGCVGLGGFVL